MFKHNLSLILILISQLINPFFNNILNFTNLQIVIGNEKLIGYNSLKYNLTKNS